VGTDMIIDLCGPQRSGRLLRNHVEVGSSIVWGGEASPALPPPSD
jgi:hypothetical protein